MLPRIDPTPVTDDAPADWLRERLQFGRKVRQWVPDSLDAYARILHPRREDGGERRTGWLPRPEIDHLTEHLAAATGTPDALWMLVWNGWGVHALEALGHRELDVSTSLTTSGRRYFICRAALEEAEEGDDGDPAFEEAPAFWWPQDRAWFACTDIDLPCTYVGGPAPLIRDILGDPRLESFPAALDDPLGGDPAPAP